MMLTAAPRRCSTALIRSMCQRQCREAATRLALSPLEAVSKSWCGTVKPAPVGALATSHGSTTTRAQGPAEKVSLTLGTRRGLRAYACMCGCSKESHAHSGSFFFVLFTWSANHVLNLYVFSLFFQCNLALGLLFPYRLLLPSWVYTRGPAPLRRRACVLPSRQS